jgi:hypothetical protein
MPAMGRRPAHYRILYLELRRGPMSQEHARPQPPAGSRRYGEGAEEPAPVTGAGAGRGRRLPNPAAQGPSWTPRSTPSPSQLPPGPRGRTEANTAATGSSDCAAGPADAGPGAGPKSGAKCQRRCQRRTQVQMSVTALLTGFFFWGAILMA